MSGENEIIISDRDRDKTYIGKFSACIREVKMETSDGSTVTIDLEGIGQIEVIPWQSHDEGSYVGTYEDRVTFHSCNGHDVQILELMAEHARKFYAVAMAQQEEIERRQEQQPDKKPMIVAGERATLELNTFALK